MDTSVERELKLEAPDNFSLARLDGNFEPYVASPVECSRLHTVYYDTDDLRLTRWGCSLRLRRDEGWTLKIPVPSSSKALYREEHVFPVEGDAIPKAALDLATAYLRGAVPRPVAELRTLRTKRHLFREGEELAEVVEDDVRVVDGAHVVSRFRELEIELAKTASDDVLDAVAERLRAVGAGKPDPTPKNVRVLGEHAREPEIFAPEVHAGSRAGDVVRAALAASVERLVRYDAKLRLGDDPEAIHQARVAVRRLRSDLRTFIPVLDRAWACELREAMRWLSDSLSTARDAEVQLTRVQRKLDELPEADRRRGDVLLARFRAERDNAYERVQRTLRDPQYVVLLSTIVDAAKRPILNPCANDDARDVIPALMADAWSKLRRTVRKRSNPPADRELHEIRIKVKRVRYAAESVVPVVGRAAKQFACTVEELQSILGEQHDAVVANRHLRTEGERPDAAFVAGELAVLEMQASMDARGRWQPVWKRAAKKKRQFWLRQ